MLVNGTVYRPNANVKNVSHVYLDFFQCAGQGLAKPSLG